MTVEMQRRCIKVMLGGKKSKGILLFGLILSSILPSLAQGESQDQIKGQLLTSSSSSSSKTHSWFNRHQQGWHFYNVPPQPPKPKNLVYREKEEFSDSQSQPQEKALKKASEAHSYTQQLKDFQEKLEESQARAVLNPTVENVREYMDLHEAVINQATKFQETWMYTSLLSMDPKDANYMSPKGREIRIQQGRQDLERRIGLLAREHGLFFVFKQGCPYCHEFAPVVKEFSIKYGFEVKAISADGGILPEFPDAEGDNGILKSINPDGIYPALYIVNPRENSVFPISWGMVNEQGLKDNIKHYLAVKDKEFPQ